MFDSSSIRSSIRLIRTPPLWPGSMFCDRVGVFVRLCYVWDPISPLTSYNDNPPYKAYLSCDTPSVLYMYMSETYKLFIKDMIAFVVHIHSKNKSMNGFRTEDLVVVEEAETPTLQFCGNLFYHADKKRKKADFRSIALVIKDKIPGWENIHLLKKLVEKLETCNCERDVYFLSKHLALMSLMEQVAFIRNTSEKKIHKDHHDYPKYKLSLKGMGSNFGWTSKLVTFSSGNGPTYECFRYGEQGYYDSLHDTERSNKSLLSFGRNLSVHIKGIIDNARSRDSVVQAEVTDEHVSALVLSQFEKQLACFQEELHRNEILDYFLGGSSASGVRPGGVGTSGVGPGGIGASGVGTGGVGTSGVGTGSVGASGVVPGGVEASGVGPGGIETSVVEPGGVGASVVGPGGSGASGVGPGVSGASAVGTGGSRQKEAKWVKWSTMPKLQKQDFITR